MKTEFFSKEQMTILILRKGKKIISESRGNEESEREREDGEKRGCQFRYKRRQERCTEGQEFEQRCVAVGRGAQYSH